jgi:hypothetical protein
LIHNNRRTTRQECRPVTAHTLITATTSDVNTYLAKCLLEGVSSLWSREEATPRELELAVWELLLDLGRALLTLLLARSCWQVTERETRGQEVSLRLDEDYTLSQSTTLGTVSVPLYAYRADGRTHAPARAEVFPLHPECRSSELLLEWESRLGCQLPFRQAEESMDFFSHGAVRIEDTTISRHLGAVGSVLDRSWTCRTPEKVAKLLANRATRDQESGKPLLYISCDAHALRRYVDDTWKAEHKMINGIRLWCIDRRNGQTIHLGGEYTWGDCREVATAMRELVERLVPVGEAAPQVVFVSDGMPWFRDWLFPVMPEGTVYILDFYHLLERLSKYAATRFGAKTKGARAWVSRATERLMGKRGYRRKKHKKRSGHRKRRGPRRRTRPTVHPSDHAMGAAEAFARDLIDDEALSMDKDLQALINYVADNADRADYPAYRARGMQIGSGAMESLHRTASQMRLKLAGARWTPDKALAVLNTRLMLLADRWQDFWGQPDLAVVLKQAFARSLGDPA